MRADDFGAYSNNPFVLPGGSAPTLVICNEHPSAYEHQADSLGPVLLATRMAVAMHAMSQPGGTHVDIRLERGMGARRLYYSSHVASYMHLERAAATIDMRLSAAADATRRWNASPACAAGERIPTGVTLADRLLRSRQNLQLSPDATTAWPTDEVSESIAAGTRQSILRPAVGSNTTGNQDTRRVFSMFRLLCGPGIQDGRIVRVLRSGAAYHALCKIRSDSGYGYTFAYTTDIAVVRAFKSDLASRLCNYNARADAEGNEDRRQDTSDDLQTVDLTRVPRGR